MRFLKKLETLILNTLFPPVCVSCKKEGDFLCMECLKGLEKKKIRSHGQKTDDTDIYYLDGVIYALDYAKNPKIQAAVKQFKYRFTQELADYFADLIVEKIGELKMVKNRRIVLIPVPLHKKRLNYRGFNQAEVIANAVKNRLTEERAEVIKLLERVRHTDQQAKLDKERRHENLKGAFKIKKDIICHSGRRRDVINRALRSRKMNTKFVQGNFPDVHAGPLFNINEGEEIKGKEKKLNKKETEKKKNRQIYFIVDDVFTTGATLENCARVLKENGLQKVYGLVVARSFK